MTIKKMNILITFGLISLVIPLSTSMMVFGSITEPKSSYTLDGSNLFYEDFSTVANKNIPASSIFGWGQGYVSAERNFTFNQLDHLVTSDPVVEIEFSGRTGYGLLYNTTSSSDQIMTFDCSDPTNIFPLGTSKVWNSGSAMDIDGSYIYLGQNHVSGYIFSVFNASDPTTIIPHWAYLVGNGVVTDIDTEGRYVYYTRYNNTAGSSLSIYDAKDPVAVSLPYYSTFTENTALGLTVEGRLAYIAASTDGLYILNITDLPNTPTVGHVAIPGNATDVIVDGRYAYVTAGYEGIFIVDIFDATNPEVIAFYDTNGYCHRLAKQGNTLIVADGPDGITIFDVANPHNPVRVLGVGAGYVKDVAFYGGIIGVASDLGVYLFELGSSTEGTTYFKRSNFINTYDDFQAWDVQIQGNIAYIAGGPDGFYTLNIEHPEAPVLLDRWYSASYLFKRLDVDGQYAYLVDTQNIIIFDISDPANIRQLSTIALFATGVTDCYVLGHELYMSWGGGSVALFDISSPATAVVANVTNELLFGNNITSVWAQGRYFYAVNNAGGSAPAIYTVSARDPSNLVISDYYSGATFMNDIFVDGEVAFTANIAWTITFDIRDPENIVYCDSPSATDSQGVAGFGQYLFVADRIEGLVMYDASDIYTQIPVSTIPELTGGLQIKTHGDYTYYANRTGLSILRHYESIGDTYVEGISVAESNTIGAIEGIIHEAVLDANTFIPLGTEIEFQMTADGGTNWETVTPGIAHTFVNPGGDLRWRAFIHNPTYRSAYIYDLSISYSYNLQPTRPVIKDLGETKLTGVFKVEWNATDDVAINHYVLELADSLSFLSPLKTWTTTKTSQMVFGLGNGLHYFRVQAFDDEGLASDWSLIETVDISVSTLVSGLILGGGLLLIITIIIVTSVIIRKKHKKLPIR
ncbi:MAG: LVIVD repeat-containing protein [Candidatus Thorarchaeota archaeon]